MIYINIQLPIMQQVYSVHSIHLYNSDSFESMLCAGDAGGIM